VGEGVINILAVSLAAGQTPLPVDVRKMLIVPVEASAILGVYVVLRFVVELNTPVPEVLHVPVDEKPEILPVNATVLLFAQTVKFGPALAMGTF
jgi:hypothetical protein